jgi:Flp pilus assembly protein TadG
VELTLALPVLLLLLLGLVDFAPAILRASQLTQAVREGAAYGHGVPSDAAGIRDRVRRTASTLGLAEADITISCASGLSGLGKACSAATYGDSLTVVATTTHRPFTPLFIGIIGPTVTITRSAMAEVYLLN